jgi:hypothetical protein
MTPATDRADNDGDRVAKRHALVDALAALPAVGAGRITREDGYA